MGRDKRISGDEVRRDKFDIRGETIVIADRVTGDFLCSLRVGPPDAEKLRKATQQYLEFPTNASLKHHKGRCPDPVGRQCSARSLGHYYFLRHTPAAHQSSLRRSCQRPVGDRHGEWRETVHRF